MKNFGAIFQKKKIMNEMMLRTKSVTYFQLFDRPIIMHRNSAHFGRCLKTRWIRPPADDQLIYEYVEY